MIAKSTRAYAALIVLSLIGLLAILYFLLFNAKSNYTEINNVHIPIIERNAINVRLNEKISRNLNLAVRLKDVDLLEEYTYDREAFAENLEEFKAEIKKLYARQIDLSTLSRRQLDLLEDEVVLQFRRKNYTKSLALLNSSQYMKESEDFNDQIYDVAEKFATLRDKYSEQQAGSLYASTFATLIVIGFILAMLLLFIRKYNTSLQEKEHFEFELEKQRVQNIQTEKLASLASLAGGVAHEINNPLAIIKGHAEIVSRELSLLKEPPLRAIKSSKIIIDTSLRVAHIVTSLKRLTLKDSIEDLKPVNVKSILEETLTLCADQFKKEKIKIYSHIDCKQPLAMAHEVELSQTIINLLKNAFDATVNAKEKKVEISLENRRNFIVLKISDTGYGINDEVVDRIFDPFFTTKDVGAGTGLGLSVSKSNIEKFGGSLKLDRTKTDTTFIIKLPIVAEAKLKETASG